jgi:hypothetical protein
MPEIRRERETQTFLSGMFGMLIIHVVSGSTILSLIV